MRAHPLARLVRFVVLASLPTLTPGCAAFFGGSGDDDDVPATPAGDAPRATPPPTGELDPVPAPPGCDTARSLRTQTACLDDAFGVFVDPTRGDDGAPGTRAAPVRTLARAAEAAGDAKARVFVCEGELAAALTATRALGIHGGFTCDDWSGTGARARLVAPPGRPALVARDVAWLHLEDVDVVAGDATRPGASSVGVVLERTRATVVNATITAGEAAQGTDGATAASNHAAGSLNGSTYAYSAVLRQEFPAAATTCTCPNGDSSTGGALDGNGSANPTPPRQNGRTSAAATYVLQVCGLGPGADGSGGDGGGPSRSAGVAEEGQWVPANGLPGQPGRVGAGGGGGHGSSEFRRGGGGACGGCGGAAGLGGGGGGASFAVLAIDAPLEAFGATFVGGQGGDGGRGGEGQPGQGGGQGGPHMSTASPVGCEGADGGNGGGGGGGGGGAGGASAGIAFAGREPRLDAASNAKAGAGGAGGQPGAPGAGGTNRLGTGRAGLGGERGLPGPREGILPLPRP